MINISLKNYVLRKVDCCGYFAYGIYLLSVYISQEWLYPASLSVYSKIKCIRKCIVSLNTADSEIDYVQKFYSSENSAPFGFQVTQVKQNVKNSFIL